MLYFLPITVPSRNRFSFRNCPLSVWYRKYRSSPSSVCMWYWLLLGEPKSAVTAQRNIWEKDEGKCISFYSINIFYYRARIIMYVTYGTQQMFTNSSKHLKFIIHLEAKIQIPKENSHSDAYRNMEWNNGRVRWKGMRLWAAAHKHFSYAHHIFILK